MINNIPIKTHLFCFILLLPLQIHAQHLVVGFTDPNEIVSINNTTVQYDTVLVMNQGRLFIDNSDFTVNQALVVSGAGSLSVKNSDFVVNGNSIFVENGAATLKDNLTFRGDIFNLGNASLKIDSAEVSIPMTFIGQYRFIGADSAEFRVSHSTFDLGSGKLGGSFSDHSSFTQLNSTYQTQLGISMTLGVAGQAALFVDNCTGGMEFVITDSADVDVSNSERFIFWHTLGQNSSADMTFPPPNSTIPNASDVSSYSFSDALPGVSGLHYSIDVTNTDVVYWALLAEAGSDVTVNNSTVLGCGFVFRESVKDTISGFVNDSSYVAFSAPLSDRIFNLNNTVIKAWNFYPQENAELVIRNSVFGEALTFNESTLVIENSICDGTGGYFGAAQNSKIYIKRSILKRIGAGPDILINTDNSKVVVEESTVTGEVVINNTSTLIYSNMNFDHEPTVNDAAFFLEVALDSTLTPNQDLLAPITGTLRSANGPLNLDTISSFRLEYSNSDSSNKTLIADLSYTQAIINDILFDWNTQGVSAGEYLLWLTPFVNGDSLISVSKEITLNTVTSIEYQTDTPGQFALHQNYPNPFNPETTILYSVPNRSRVTIQIYNTLGQVIRILVDEELASGEHRIIWNGRDTQGQSVASGVYLFQMRAAKQVFQKKLVLLR